MSKALKAANKVRKSSLVLRCCGLGWIGDICARFRCGAPWLGSKIATMGAFSNSSSNVTFRVIMCRWGRASTSDACLLLLKALISLSSQNIDFVSSLFRYCGVETIVGGICGGVLSSLRCCCFGSSAQASIPGNNNNTPPPPAGRRGIANAESANCEKLS